MRSIKNETRIFDIVTNRNHKNQKFHLTLTQMAEAESTQGRCRVETAAGGKVMWIWGEKINLIIFGFLALLSSFL